MALNVIAAMQRFSRYQGHSGLVLAGVYRVLMVESRCGAVAVGRTYLFPPLSSDGALVVRP